MTNGHQDDLVVEGFHILDEQYVSRRPPKIQWGTKYLLWSPAEKIRYLEKLASSMNHAAYLVQEERNELNRLIILKEQQLVKLNDAVRLNNAMLQQEVTTMNEQRQGYNQEIARLNEENKKLIRELNLVRPDGI